MIDQNMVNTLGPLLRTGAALDMIAGEATAEILARVEHGRPDTKYLRALGDELILAQKSPSAVPYPELVDADVYWTKAAWPQAAALVASVRAYLTELEPRIEMVMIDSESDLKSWVQGLVFDGVEVADSAADPREEVIDAIVQRCEQFDTMLRTLASIAPPLEPVVVLRTEFEVARHRAAVGEVKKLKAVYLRQAGGDADHQRRAKEEWQATFETRVEHRAVELQAELPWRHQELAIDAHERAVETVHDDVTRMIDRLTMALLSIGERLVLFYDQARTGRSF